MMHIAIKAALLSSFRQRMGAAVVKGGRVLSVACNAVRHKEGRFSRKWINSLHAEQAALLMLSEQSRKGASIYVARVKKDGSLGNSFPCPHCMELIVNSGVKEVFYINEEGKEERWKN